MEPAGVVLLGPCQTAIAMNSWAAQVWDSPELAVVREGLCSPQHKVVDGRWFRIDRDTNRQPYLACITRLTDGGYSEYRVLSIYDPEMSIAVSRSILEEAYRFTKAELRLAEQLLLGRTPNEASVALGVTVHTVRTYLKRLFNKVGVRSQATLMRRLVQIASVALPSPPESAIPYSIHPDSAVPDTLLPEPAQDRAVA